MEPRGLVRSAANGMTAAVSRGRQPRAAASTGVPAASTLALVLVLLLLAAPALAGDRASVSFSLQRNDLRSERIAAVRDLKDLDDEIADGEKPVTVSGTVGRANTVHNMRAGHVVRLRNRRQRIVSRIDGIDRRFDTLTDRVVAHYGEQPAWWSGIK